MNIVLRYIVMTTYNIWILTISYLYNEIIIIALIFN